MLSDYELCEFSNPFDTSWIIALKNSMLDRQLVIVGSGVTADEYKKLLTANNFSCTLVNVSDFKKLVCRESPVEYAKSLFIFASPTSSLVLHEIAKEAGLLPAIDYFSYHQLMRNRAVFDLRNVTGQLNQTAFVNALNSICNINTMAGVDVLVRGTSMLPAIDLCLQAFKSRLNIKYVLYVAVEGFRISERVFHHHAMEINFINTKISSEISINFLSSLESYLLEDPKAYVLMTKEQIEMLGLSNHHRIFLDLYHPEYYDSLLSDFENKVFDLETIYEFKPGKLCLSRRMFPVMDADFKLKTCSLYDSMSRTNFAIEDLYNSSYIKQRQQLCVRCTTSNLHRLI